LGEYVYLYLDARYEKVRQDGQVRDAAVLIAAGVNGRGQREILGLSVALGEQEVHWRAFLQDLVQRGLRGVRLIISDAHSGLQAARQAVFGGVPWQRCQFHLQQNAQAYVPRQSMSAEVADDLRTIFNAPDRATAEAWLAQTVKKYETSASRLADWMETNIPQGLTVFSFPKSHQRRIRTANLLERLSREIKRRTRVVGIFPNPAACARLISAFLMEQSEAWLIGPIYLNFEGSEERVLLSSPS
jgi:transposase-like protein